MISAFFLFVVCLLIDCLLASDLIRKLRTKVTLIKISEESYLPFNGLKTA